MTYSEKLELIQRSRFGNHWFQDPLPPGPDRCIYCGINLVVDEVLGSRCTYPETSDELSAKIFAERELRRAKEQWNEEHPECQWRLT